MRFRQGSRSRLPLGLLLTIILLLGVAASGCLQDFDDPPPENRLQVHEIDITAPHVASGQVTLRVNVTLDNRHSESGEVELLFKAFDKATTLRETSRTVPLGVLDADSLTDLEVDLTLSKDSRYRIDVIAVEDGRPRDAESVQVSNLGALPSHLLDTGMRVGQLEFMVDNSSDDHVAIDAHIYITNEASETSKPLMVQIKARETSTKLLADEAWEPVETIEPEATKILRSALNAPGDFNYVIEAVLWAGDHRVGQGHGNVQLIRDFTDEASPSPTPSPDIVTEPTDPPEFDDPAPEHDGDEGEDAPAPAIALFLVIIASTIYLYRRKHA